MNRGACAQSEAKRIARERRRSAGVGRVVHAESHFASKSLPSFAAASLRPCVCTGCACVCTACSDEANADTAWGFAGAIGPAGIGCAAPIAILAPCALLPPAIWECAVGKAGMAGCGGGGAGCGGGGGACGGGGAEACDGGACGGGGGWGWAPSGPADMMPPAGCLEAGGAAPLISGGGVALGGGVASTLSVGITAAGEAMAPSPRIPLLAIPLLFVACG